MSRAQVTRLIAAYRATGRVQASQYERHRFSTRYTKTDLTLLASVDKAHGNLSGQATRHILQREHEVSGIAAYEPRISSARIYRLRATVAYHMRNASYEPTLPTAHAQHAEVSTAVYGEHRRRKGQELPSTKKGSRNPERSPACQSATPRPFWTR